MYRDQQETGLVIPHGQIKRPHNRALLNIEPGLNRARRPFDLRVLR